jgi:hypothetical protein
MERKRNNTAIRLAMLQTELSDEINSGLANAIRNLDLCRNVEPEIIRRVRDELVALRNLSILLANSTRLEPRQIVRENVKPLRQVAAE